VNYAAIIQNASAFETFPAATGYACIALREHALFASGMSIFILLIYFLECCAGLILRRFGAETLGLYVTRRGTRWVNAAYLLLNPMI
jgi:hypothetical protein